MTARMKAKPHHQNGDCHRKESEPRKTLLKPNQNKADQRCQKWQEHIHKGILAQDSLRSGKSLKQDPKYGLSKESLFRMTS